MYTVREKVIHLLGGKTKTECDANFRLGRSVAYQEMETHMRSLFGKTSSEWAASVWASVCGKSRKCLTEDISGNDE